MVNYLVIASCKCRNPSFMENTPIRTVVVLIRISRADLFCCAHHNFISLIMAD